jgi:hypothetical protein
MEYDTSLGSVCTVMKGDIGLLNIDQYIPVDTADRAYI